jgi:uncharacterized DUF497 family protein
MALQFEWDEEKSKKNLKKHGVALRRPARFSATRLH